MLASPVHEHRFAALEILVAQYERGGEDERRGIFDLYLQQTPRINNRDLVDTSAPYIVGEHLLTHPRAILDKLASPPILWERRIAIVTTLGLVRRGELKDTFRIARKLLGDKEPLIHKAVGWILREAGKASRPELVSFLEKHSARMPRTTLRYAIERFTAEERKQWLAISRNDDPSKVHWCLPEAGDDPAHIISGVCGVYSECLESAGLDGTIDQRPNDVIPESKINNLRKCHQALYNAARANPQIKGSKTTQEWLEHQVLPGTQAKSFAIPNELGRPH